MRFSSVIGFVTLAVGALVPIQALIYAVDSSTLVLAPTFARAKSQGFTKAIIRGYQEACASGGRVDPNFVPTYKNARAAGITNIDAYWFPCTGANNKCKSFSTQLSELVQTFTANNMAIGRIWLDIESDTQICKNWNYGAAGNLNVAKQINAALQASGYPFGIYSSPGEWANVFGNTGAVLNNQVPLWFATFDNVQDLNLKRPFGGWTSAYAKQYTDQSASGQFDLNVFTA